jgi:hypothetical protein
MVILLEWMVWQGCADLDKIMHTLLVAQVKLHYI